MAAPGTEGGNERQCCGGADEIGGGWCAAHPRERSVPHDSRQLGHERGDRHRGRGRRDDRDRDPVGHHALHAGDGDAHGGRREDRLDDRQAAGIRDRVRHLRVRLPHHGTRAEPDCAYSRLVGPRRHRCRPHPPGHRRSRRRELPARGQTPRLRPGDGRRRDRRRCRPAHRRHRHHVLLLALGVRRRGRCRDRDPGPGQAGTGHPAGGQTQVRRRRCGARRRGSRVDGVGDPALVGLGLGEAQIGGAVAARNLSDGLVRPGRPVGHLGVLRARIPTGSARRRTAGEALAVRQPADERAGC